MVLNREHDHLEGDAHSGDEHEENRLGGFALITDQNPCGHAGDHRDRNQRAYSNYNRIFEGIKVVKGRICQHCLDIGNQLTEIGGHSKCILHDFRIGTHGVHQHNDKGNHEQGKEDDAGGLQNKGLGLSLPGSFLDSLGLHYISTSLRLVIET